MDENIKIEFKRKLYSKCECCGELYIYETYINDNLYEEFRNVDTEDQVILKHIVKEYNEGVKVFNLTLLEDIESEDYLLVNGDVFKGVYDAEKIEILLVELQVDFNVYFSDLKLLNESN